MDDLVESVELRLVLEHDVSKRGAVEIAFLVENGRPHFFTIASRAGLPLCYGFARKHVGVDYRRTSLSEHVRDRRLSAGDVSSKSDDLHQK